MQPYLLPNDIWQQVAANLGGPREWARCSGACKEMQAVQFNNLDMVLTNRNIVWASRHWHGVQGLVFHLDDDFDQGSALVSMALWRGAAQLHALKELQIRGRRDQGR